MAIDTKDMYVELKLTAIKDGSVWAESLIRSPNQSKESYTTIEKDLMEVLAKWGAMSISPEGFPPSQPPPKRVA